MNSDGTWKLQFGGWRLEVGGWRLEVGGWRLEVGVGTLHLEVGMSLFGHGSIYTWFKHQNIKTSSTMAIKSLAVVLILFYLGKLA